MSTQPLLSSVTTSTVTNPPKPVQSTDTNTNMPTDASKHDSTPGAAEDILLVFPLLMFVIFAVLALLMAKRAPPADSSQPTKDVAAFISSLWAYIKEHSYISASLSLFTALCYAFWAYIFRFQHPKSHWVSIEEMALALFAGFATALIIFLLTDFAAKRAQELGNEAIKTAFDAHSTALGDLLAVSTTSGLRAYPSIEGKRLLPKQIFDQYLENEDVVRVSSSAGTRWMQLEQSDHVSKDRLTLPILRQRNVTLRLLVHSPLAEVLSLLDESCHQTPRAPKCIATLLSKRNIPLSQVSVAQGLIDHLKFFQTTLPALQLEADRHPNFKMEVKLTSSRLNSDFFTVGSRAVFGAYPMANRSHQHAISVSVRDPLRTAASASSENLVKVFTDEFDHFWNDPTFACDFGKFMSDHKDLMGLLLHESEMLSDLTT